MPWLAARRQVLARELRSTSEPGPPIAELVRWRPQPRQQTALEACGFGQVLAGGPVEPPQAPLIGYGGAAGGGKTDLDCGLAAIAMEAVPGIQVAVFRRTYPELEGAEGVIERSRAIVGVLPGAAYNSTKHRWSLPNGSCLWFRACQFEADRFSFQSQQFDILILDEATHFTWVIADYLLTRNRANVRWPGHERGYPFALFTTNPGNVGHWWYRQLFVDSGPREVAHDAESPNGKRAHVVFIPALLEDNQILMERDPEYEQRLEDRDPVTARALRHGDWEVAAGLFFARHWRSVPRDDKPAHVVPAFAITSEHVLYGSVDYGFASSSPDSKPFVYGLYASDRLGHVYRIDELAAANWDPMEQIAAIRELEARYPTRPRYRVGCPSMFIRRAEGAPTIAEEYAKGGVPVVEPHTDRINGWARCIMWLLDAPDGLPWFMSFDHCTHFNRQIPSLPVEDGRQDEVDRDAEDHAAEEWRHFLMSRPQPARVADQKPHPHSAAAIMAAARAERERD